MAKRAHEAPAAMPPTQFTQVKIGGETYRLAYSFNGLAEAEAITGCNLLQGMREVIVGGLTAANFRGILYAALRKAQPGITLAGAGDLLETAFRDGETLEVQKALLATYGISFEQTDPSVAAPQAEHSGDSNIASYGSTSGEPLEST